MNSLHALIQKEIEETGAISFACFMELALYAPGLGYYEQKANIGRHGDYYTSVSVGRLFGELLAFQFAEWFSELLPETLESTKSTFRFQIVEAGAHDGQLALDLLKALRDRHPQVFEQTEYCIVEPSKERREWQTATLSGFSNRVRWFDAVEDLPAVRGVIFCNELLDAMPVHQLAWNATEKQWVERGVGWDGKNFVWESMADVSKSLNGLTPDLPRDLLVVLPDGFRTEVSPAANDWWTRAAQSLHRGKLMAIDYGLKSEEFFQPERCAGTLRAYSKHRGDGDLLSNVGSQDITAHVNFSTLEATGADAGLRSQPLISQSTFLTRIAEKLWNRTGEPPAWNAQQARQFQTLTHPEHLGRPFRVLIQSR